MFYYFLLGVCATWARILLMTNKVFLNVIERKKERSRGQVDKASVYAACACADDIRTQVRIPVSAVSILTFGPALEYINSSAAI